MPMPASYPLTVDAAVYKARSHVLKVPRGTGWFIVLPVSPDDLKGFTRQIECVGQVEATATLALHRAILALEFLEKLDDLSRLAAERMVMESPRRSLSAIVEQAAQEYAGRPGNGPLEAETDPAGADEDAEDAAAFAEAVAADDGTRIPLSVLKAQLGGSHLVKAWREHRRMTQTALSASSGVSTPFISQVESGRRRCSVATLEKLAAGLGVPLSVLTE